MTLAILRSACFDAWPLLKASVTEALDGDVLDLEDKVALAAAWSLIHNVLGGADADEGEAEVALGTLHSAAFAPWMVRMMSENYPGADGSAPALMRAAYDAVATHLEQPLSANLI